MRFRQALQVFSLLFALGCGGAYGRAINRGNELARQGQWDLAAAEYARAASLDPGNAEAAQLLRWARRNQAIERVNRARALLGRGDAPGALALAREATELDPTNSGAHQVLAESGARTLDLAENLMAGGDKRQALELTTAVLQALPADARARQLDGALRAQLAAEAYNRGEAFAQQGALGNALLAMTASTLYVPGYRDATARAEQLQHDLRREVTFFAVLAGFSADASAQDLATGVTLDRLRQTFEPALPLTVAAEAPEAGLSAVPASAGPEPRGSGRAWVSVGVRLSGSFERYAFRNEHAPEARSCDYVCGRSTVANPSFAAAVTTLGETRAALPAAETELARAQAESVRWNAELDDLHRTIDRAERRAEAARLALEQCRARARAGGDETCAAEQVADTRATERAAAARAGLPALTTNVDGARERLTRAEDRHASARADIERAAAEVDATPRTMEVARHCTYSYTAEVHTTEATAAVTLSGEDLLDGARVFDREPLRLASRDRDQTFPPQPDRCAEVAAGDPLNLASELDLKRTLVTQAVSGLHDKILVAYDRHRERALAAARRDEAAGAIDEAAERYVRYLVLGRTGAERAQIVAYLARASGATPAAIEQLL